MSSINRLFSVLRLLPLLLFVVSTAGAQSAAVLTGRVTSSANGQPVAGATVQLGGSQLGTTTRGDGTYRLQVAPGSYELRVNALGFASQRDSVRLVAGRAETRDFRLVPSALDLDALVVVGSRTERRTVTSAPVPVDVLTADVIRQTGLTETPQIIQLLAPSFNFPRPSVTDGTDHVRPATLRGLAPDQVLVLVNGKRRHNSALVNVNGSVGRGSTAVDLNAIPANSIERIEILRDGAAAQYGSDAIAGVINIVLKSGDAAEVNSEVGQTREGDGQVVEAGLNYGKGWSSGASFNVSADVRDRGATNRSRPDKRQQYFTGDPRNAAYAANPQITHRYGDASTRDADAFLNAELPLGGATAYGFGGLSRRRGEAAGFFRRPLDDRTVRALYPNGFLPLIQSEIWDGSGAGGVRGTLRGWSWDLSSVYGRNSFAFDVDHSANVSLGTASPTHFYAGTLRFDQWTSNLDLQRDVALGLSSPLSVAVGAEFRRDGYGIGAGDPASYQDGGVAVLDGPNAGRRAAVGSQVFPGFRPTDAVDASRHNVAGYLDLEGNVTEQLLVGLAGRVEDYSDFGSTATGKATARFEPVHGFALRGALANGFRAPSLAQSYFSATATNFQNVNGVSTPFDVRTFPVTSPEAQVLGAQPLKPEKSVNYSAGLALNPRANLSATVDYYRIDIADRIVLSGNFVGSSVQRLLENRGFRGLSGGRFFTNAIDTRTNGVDVVVNYGARLGRDGLFRLTGGYNHNQTRVTRVASTPPQLSSFQEQLFDRVERGRIEKGQPRDNLSLSLNYTQGPVGVTLYEKRYGQVTTFGSSMITLPDGTRGFPDQTFGAKWLTDVDVALHPTRFLTVAIGANNLFDVYPDLNIPGNDNSGIFPYNGLSPFGFNGQFYYLRLNVHRRR